LTLPQACILLAAALPQRTLTPQEAIATIRYIQASNHKAKLSHYRHRLKRPDTPGEASL
jgi:hypothetical protein